MLRLAGLPSPGTRNGLRYLRQPRGQFIVSISGCFEAASGMKLAWKVDVPFRPVNKDADANEIGSCTRDDMKDSLQGNAGGLNVINKELTCSLLDLATSLEKTSLVLGLHINDGQFHL